MRIFNLLHLLKNESCNKNKKLFPVAVLLCTMPSFGRGFISVLSNPLTTKKTLSELYCHLVI